MGDLAISHYIRTYVCTWYRNMSHSGMLLGMLQVSCWPIELYLPQGLDGAVRARRYRSTTLFRSVDEYAVPPRACRTGAATYGVKHSAQST